MRLVAWALRRGGLSDSNLFQESCLNGKFLKETKMGFAHLAFF